MHATEALVEADRLMTVCNSCRYCEGLCAVFPAMEMRHAFADGDLNYLANLCHGCGACYYDCQFAPPHEFAVNVPLVLATVRANSYAAYAWPRPMRKLFSNNGKAVAIIAVVCVVAFVAGLADRGRAGTFYAVMPHNAMAALFGIVFLGALVAMGLGVRAFWRDAGASMAVACDARALWQAAKDAASLRYLDGGGAGCHNADERPVDPRRHAHHAVAYGFLLCLAATSVATLYHYLLGREAPYPWYDLPVVLGTLGGIGMVGGCIVLLAARRDRDPALRDVARGGMDVAFIVMLLLSGASGLVLLALGDTAAMGTLLAVHLGVVLALFVTLPYGKFVHGIYRFAALARYARERRMIETGA